MALPASAALLVREERLLRAGVCRVVRGGLEGGERGGERRVGRGEPEGREVRVVRDVQGVRVRVVGVGVVQRVGGGQVVLAVFAYTPRSIVNNKGEWEEGRTLGWGCTNRLQRSPLRFRGNADSSRGRLDGRSCARG
jgi:hypothetical protein